MDIILTGNKKFRNEVIQLYLEGFSSGISAQHIDKIEMEKYIDSFFIRREVLLSILNNSVMGVLLFSPLIKDKLLPEEIKNKYDIEKCAYIAELFVAESARGKGIGKNLLKKFFDIIDHGIYTHVFIRVWDKNISALALYEKLGFKTVANIRQTKNKLNGTETFYMNKIYLHKEIV